MMLCRLDFDPALCCQQHHLVLATEPPIALQLRLLSWLVLRLVVLLVSAVLLLIYLAVANSSAILTQLASLRYDQK